MSQKDKIKAPELEVQDESSSQREHNTNEQLDLKSEEEQTENTETNSSEEQDVPSPLEKAESELAELKDSYLRLRAEYDNFRKRTLKEKSDLIKFGGEGVLKAFLNIVDDFNIAYANVQKAQDTQAVIEGLDLIKTKIISELTSQGVKEMEVTGIEFNPDEHEAVAMIATPEDAQKGKVLECIQKGYTLNGKVIRHPKVVVGN